MESDTFDARYYRKLVANYSASKEQAAKDVARAIVMQATPEFVACLTKAANTGRQDALVKLHYPLNQAVYHLGDELYSSFKNFQEISCTRCIDEGREFDDESLGLVEILFRW